MIVEQDLIEAIAECQGQKNPNANTCIKLAAFLTIQRELFGVKDQQVPVEGYSFSAPEIGYSSETEFGQMVANRDVDEILSIMDELMSTLQVINPKLYDSVIRRI